MAKNADKKRRKEEEKMYFQSTDEPNIQTDLLVICRPKMALEQSPDHWNILPSFSFSRYGFGIETSACIGFFTKKYQWVGIKI